MSFKKATLKHPDRPLAFYFPQEFDDEAISDAIKAIRTGTKQNWRREFRGLEVEVSTVEQIELEYDSKYIVLHTKKIVNSARYMIIFPKSINHDWLFEVAQMATFESEFPNDENPHSISSAGFVSDGGYCKGRSETLNVESHKDDSVLFKKQFKQKNVSMKMAA